MSDERDKTNWRKIVDLTAAISSIAGAIAALATLTSITSLPVFAAILAVIASAVRTFEKAIEIRLMIGPTKLSFILRSASNVVGKKMQFGPSSGLVAELLKSESKATYSVVIFSMIAAFTMYFFHFGDWRFPGGIAALALLRHGLTVYRITTNRFGTTPDELIELMSCLRQLDRTGKTPPDQTGLAEPVLKHKETFNPAAAAANRGI